MNTRPVALVLVLTFAPVVVAAGEVEDEAAMVDRVLDMAQSKVDGASAEVRKVAPRAWATVVRQVQIEGVWDVVGTLALGLGLAMFARWAVRKGTQLVDDDDDARGAGLIATGVIAGLVAVGLFVAWAIGFDEAFGKVVNPGYAAAVRLFGFVRGGR